jgi:hypothetical protein
MTINAQRLRFGAQVRQERPELVSRLLRKVGRLLVDGRARSRRERSIGIPRDLPDDRVVADQVAVALLGLERLDDRVVTFVAPLGQALLAVGM